MLDKLDSKAGFFRVTLTESISRLLQPSESLLGQVQLLVHIFSILHRCLEGRRREGARGEDKDEGKKRRRRDIVERRGEMRRRRDEEEER